VFFSGDEAVPVPRTLACDGPCTVMIKETLALGRRGEQSSRLLLARQCSQLLRRKSREWAS